MNDLLLTIASIVNEPTPRAQQRDAIIRAAKEWAAETREPGRARQAAAWLQDRPNRTVAEAAKLFGITEGAVTVAKRAGPFAPYEGEHANILDAPPRQNVGAAKQAAAWLQDRPFATTKEAARLFGVTYGSVASARLDGPHEAYSGPHNAVPDPVPANLPALLDAIRWFRADEYRRSEKMAAAMFRVRVSDLRRAMYYADREDPDEVPPR